MLWNNHIICVVFFSGDTHVITAPKEMLPRLCLTTHSHTTVNGRRALMSGRGRFYRMGKKMSFPHEKDQAWGPVSLSCQLIKLCAAHLCDYCSSKRLCVSKQLSFLQIHSTTYLNEQKSHGFIHYVHRQK